MPSSDGVQVGSDFLDDFCHVVVKFPRKMVRKWGGSFFVHPYVGYWIDAEACDVIKGIRAGVYPS
jgi:hypothetical protein